MRVSVRRYALVGPEYATNEPLVHMAAHEFMTVALEGIDVTPGLKEALIEASRSQAAAALYKRAFESFADSQNAD